MNVNNWKAAGVIYRISETEMVGRKKDFAKRYVWLEIPSLNSMDRQNTEIPKFTVLGPECGSLDWYEVGEWVEILFKLEGRFQMWTPEGESEAKELHFGGARILDISRAPNPFEMNQEPESPSIDEISPDLFNVLEKKSEEMKEKKEPDPIGPPIDDDDDLPF